MTIKELEEKEVELRASIDTADTKEKLEEIERSLNELQEQRKNYNETKNKMEERFKNMDKITNLVESRKDDEKVDIRRAFAKSVLFKSTNRADAKPTNAEIGRASCRERV